MPVAVEPFAAEQLFPAYDRFARDSAHAGTTAVECAACGYEPAGDVPERCPRCGGSCWERYVRAGMVDGGVTHVRARQSSNDLRGC